MQTFKEIQKQTTWITTRDSEWQCIRLELLGCWGKHISKEQIEKQLQKLDLYMEDGINPVKVRCVLNYLSALRASYRYHPAIRILLSKASNLWRLGLDKEEEKI